jgi:hypothetical protein
MTKNPLRILLVLATAVVCGSCGRDAAPVSSTPKLDFGEYYTITFPKDSAFTQQTAFKVVDASGGSWIQVETYENPMDLFALQVATGMAAGEEPQAEREKRMKDALTALRNSVQLKWINLNQATSIFKTPDETLGVLKEL